MIFFIEPVALKCQFPDNQRLDRNGNLFSFFKVGKNYKDPSMTSSQALSSSTILRPPMTRVNHGKVDISKVSSRLTEAIAVIAERAEIRVGDQVMVSGLGGKQTTSCSGVVRFVGAVDFVDDDSK